MKETIKTIKINKISIHTKSLIIEDKIFVATALFLKTNNLFSANYLIMLYHFSSPNCNNILFKKRTIL